MTDQIIGWVCAGVGVVVPTLGILMPTGKNRESVPLLCVMIGSVFLGVSFRLL